MKRSKNFVVDGLMKPIKVPTIVIIAAAAFIEQDLHRLLGIESLSARVAFDSVFCLALLTGLTVLSRNQKKKKSHA